MTSVVKNIKSILPGFIVALIVALSSMFLAKFVPALGAAPIAIFLGMFVGNIFLNQKVFQRGYKFSESDLLSYSIVLLGATLSISTISEIGLNGVMFIVLQMTATIIGALYIGKKLGFAQNFRFLMASGNAVCGSSAIAATAPVIDADDNDKGIAITIVNVTGIVLMFLLPLLGDILYKNDTLHTSAIIGGILQSMGQVVASGAMVNEGVKDLSTIFKIVRIIFLVVVVFVFGHLKNKTNKEIAVEEVEDVKNRKIKVPWYVIGFFIMCGLFSVNIISSDLSALCKEVSKVLEIIALAAIGLRVNIRELIKQGKNATLYAMFVGLVQIVSAVVLIGILL
ncbi:MAG: putative sulfate exporter family transporter [Clostridiales bacterium]|uniref:YeiH family protein n=1 Tax=Terrisporobacter sp. TaxID=1965305 RepID=UPI002A433D95|nr:putative sulfate exporter family transporter [Terrisporobacter sp.]MCI6458768.1 putative sulfate exporter family transporter [Clostridium sp.]MDD5879679.1 putative sulfate exporter family transporter [Clostridiales bacterium]MDD7754777.1 putative sulfate exporter family transporter [Clostridiales bacterium]MDY4136591.1 putative sulfate exporter family transporter [Terrisporobacter sp.]MDY6154015.1 putative sulfate exporter family transporter [Terrisporobacter sp.]